MLPILDIEMTFDLICPWCWIGKRNLDNALNHIRRDFPKLDVHLRWCGVQLLPETPEEGLSFIDFYKRRLGGEAAVRQRQEQVNTVAAQAGLQVNFERIKIFPNTAKAHRVLNFVKSFGSAAQYATLLEILFSSYFFEGKNISDSKWLLEVASNVGMRGPLRLEIELLIGINGLSTDVGNRSNGIAADTPSQFSSIPLMVINGRHRLTGAQSVENLMHAFSNIITDKPLHDTPISAAE